MSVAATSTQTTPYGYGGATTAQGQAVENLGMAMFSGQPSPRMIERCLNAKGRRYVAGL